MIVLTKPSLASTKYIDIYENTNENIKNKYYLLYNYPTYTLLHEFCFATLFFLLFLYFFIIK